MTEKYKDFVIYKIFNLLTPEIFYIGSTVNFSRRKSQHKKGTTNKTSKAYHYPLYQFIRVVGGFDYFTMEIYERYPCNSREEGRIREQEIIDLLKPELNMIGSAIKKMD